MTGTWSVVAFGGPDGINRSWDGLSFAEANELVDLLRETETYAMIHPAGNGATERNLDGSRHPSPEGGSSANASAELRQRT